mgnify:CR=1 FL=1
MTGRKIGVGFNQPRIIEGRRRYDPRKSWAFARKFTRIVLGRDRTWRWQKPWAASAVETHRVIVRDAENP